MLTSIRKHARFIEIKCTTNGRLSLQNRIIWSTTNLHSVDRIKLVTFYLPKTATENPSADNRKSSVDRIVGFGYRILPETFCHLKSTAELVFPDGRTLSDRSKTKMWSTKLFKTFFSVMSEPNPVVQKSPPIIWKT